MSTSAIIAMALAAPVQASEAPAVSNANPGDGGEIIVTAQKRNERLQDIPVAASVIGSDVLVRANATDITDINKLVPSVQIKGTYNGRVPLGIRGISTNANEGAVGLTSGVAIQIDGVPVPPDSFAANALDDIAQIEVLKGPQATLGGRTASAGVINIVTGAPSNVLKGKASVSVTDDNEQRGNLSISGPLAEGLTFSLAGFGAHTQYLVRNTLTGQNAKSTNYGARAKLKYTSGDFDATLMGRMSHFHSDGGTFTQQYLTPGAPLFPFIPSEFNGPGGSPSFYGIRQSVAFPGINIHYGNTDSASQVTGMFATWKDSDTSLTMNYRSGGLTLSSITAYQRETQDSKQDVTLAGVAFFNILTGGNAPAWFNDQNIGETVTQFSQEFKLASDAERPVSVLAGLFFSSNRVVNTELRAFVGNPLSFLTDSNTKTLAAYGRATAKLAENTSVTAGLRFNHDTLSFQKTQYFDPASGQFQGCGTGVTCTSAPNSDNSDNVVGDISLRQKFGDDVSAYGSFTRGYKPRAFNTAYDFTVAGGTLAATGKETIKSFEVGLKSKLFNRRATLNIAAFNTVYNNYQVQIFPIVAGGLAPLELSSAGKARTQGVEADFDARIGAGTTLTVSAAYIDAKFLRFQNAPCYGDQTAALGCVSGAQDLSGKPMPDAPKFKLNVDLEHRIPVGGNGTEVVLGGNVAYRSSALFQANNNPQTAQPAFALVNLSAGVDLAGGKYNLTVFVNNVTNHFYLTNAEDFFSGLFGPGPINGPANDVIGQPARDAHRYVGGRLTARF
jgi:iron complex outermembrane receptor protein